MQSAERVFWSKCRDIVVQHGDVMKRLYEEITHEVDASGVMGNTAFEVASKYIDREATKRGARLMLTKLQQYSDKSYET